MISTIFGKAGDLLDKRFVVALVVPCLAFLAGVGSLAITAYGWKSAYTLWQSLSNGQRWLILGGAVVGVFFVASILGAQINSLVRYWEGYWPGVFRIPGVRLQCRRYHSLTDSDRDSTRKFSEFPSSTADFLPTRLGNVLLAAENYSRERYGLDSVFFWPRQYLLLATDVQRD